MKFESSNLALLYLYTFECDNFVLLIKRNIQMMILLIDINFAL